MRHFALTEERLLAQYEVPQAAPELNSKRFGKHLDDNKSIKAA